MRSIRILLKELQDDAGQVLQSLAEHVGLTTPAVIERVRKLEDAGIILGYRAEIDTAKVGLPIMAFVRMSITGVDYSHIIEVAEKFGRSARMPSRNRRRFFHNEGRRRIRRTPTRSDRPPRPIRHYDHNDRSLIAGKTPGHRYLKCKKTPIE